MEPSQYIRITHLCTQYQVTEAWFTQFHDNGLFTISTYDAHPCIHIDQIEKVEKALRLHQDLKVNAEGIDIIFNLLEKVERLNADVKMLQSKLNLHQDL